MLVRSVSPMLFAAALLASSASSAMAQDPVRYGLAPPSEFAWGCFGPCACPVQIREPMAGTFVLRRSHVDPLYQYYDVLDVRWKAPDATTSVSITGSGTYRRGGETALMEELTLDLSFDGGPLQRFTSGLRPVGATFPEIATQISLHQGFCFDSVLAVDAEPLGPAGVGGGSAPASLGVAPNPFTVAVDVAFALPRDGAVRLGVYDLLGRRVATMLEGTWLEAGPHHRAWDGTGQDGALVPPGMYLVRLDTAAGRVVRTLAKLL